MPRPRTIDDELVLDAVTHVIGEVGPGGLTLALVAREVGLSPATLVQRFGSKRSLLLAVAARGSAGAALDEHATAGRPPLAALVNGLVARTIGAGTPEALANHLAFLQMDLADPEFHALALDDAMHVRERIEALLRRATAAGELEGADPAELARSLQVTFNGALVSWAIERDGALSDYLRRELEARLAPYRSTA